MSILKDIFAAIRGKNTSPEEKPEASRKNEMLQKLEADMAIKAIVAGDNQLLNLDRLGDIAAQNEDIARDMALPLFEKLRGLNTDDDYMSAITNQYVKIGCVHENLAKEQAIPALIDMVDKKKRSVNCLVPDYGGMDQF